jgi:hypothetical protein
MKIKKIIKKYTFIEKSDGKWEVFFRVGCQTFLIAYDKNKADAKWEAEMLAIAIQNLLEEQK